MRSVTDAIDLRPGDVVVLGPGESRTLHHVELTPTQKAATCFWSDGSSTSVDRWRTWTVLHRALPDPRTPSAPPPPPDTTDTEESQ